MALAKADFYFGSLLSRLVGTGFAPAIIDEGEKRRIYSLANDYGDYTVYAKYASKPDSDRKDSNRWDFKFNSDELFSIKSAHNLSQYIFAFICGVENLRDSEIVLLTYDELKKCIGKNDQTLSHRVSVRSDKGSWSFLVYGTGLDGKNPIKITRNLDKRLKELSTVPV